MVVKEEEPQQPRPELKKVPKLLDEYEDDEEDEEVRTRFTQRKSGGRAGSQVEQLLPIIFTPKSSQLID